jgi:two-component system chemotaxis response regulator CheY
MNQSDQTILIVDDSETVRTQLKTVLEQAGYAILEAQDGIEGVAQAIEHPHTALILADVNMPKMDGLTMCVKIKQNTALVMIPIVMLTTETNAELKAQGKAIGITAWIIKPFNAGKIISGISKIISSNQHTANPKAA